MRVDEQGGDPSDSDVLPQRPSLPLRPQMQTGQMLLHTRFRNWLRQFRRWVLVTLPDGSDGYGDEQNYAGRGGDEIHTWISIVRGSDAVWTRLMIALLNESAYFESQFVFAINLRHFKAQDGTLVRQWVIVLTVGVREGCDMEFIAMLQNTKDAFDAAQTDASRPGGANNRKDRHDDAEAAFPQDEEHNEDSRRETSREEEPAAREDRTPAADTGGAGVRKSNIQALPPVTVDGVQITRYRFPLSQPTNRGAGGMVVVPSKGGGTAPDIGRRAGLDADEVPVGEQEVLDGFYSNWA